MSIVDPTPFAERLSRIAEAAATLYDVGQAHAAFTKCGSTAVNTYGLAGQLQLAASGWLLVTVPNPIVRGLFDALHEPGAELPYHTDGKLNAHISVMSPDEIAKIGGPNKITERGHTVRYQLGPIRTVAPTGWPGYSKVWYVTAISPEIEQIRKSYGLSPRRKDFDLHITFARRKAGVLYDNAVRKT